jgi:hypothetical protein
MAEPTARIEAMSSREERGSGMLPDRSKRRPKVKAKAAAEAGLELAEDGIPDEQDQHKLDTMA